MKLNEALNILKQNGYKTEKQLLNEDWQDLISFLFSAYFAWAGFQTIAGLIGSCRDPGALKDIIKKIETNKEGLTKLALLTLYSSGIPGKLQLKLETLTYDQLWFLIKKGMLEGETEAEANPGMIVRNLQDKPDKMREYGEYIITLYTDILYEALHEDDEDIKKLLDSHIAEYKNLTTIKNRFKNMWNTLKFMWSSKDSDKRKLDAINQKQQSLTKKRIKLIKLAEKKKGKLDPDGFNALCKKVIQAAFDEGNEEKAIAYITDYLNN